MGTLAFLYELYFTPFIPIRKEKFYGFFYFFCKNLKRTAKTGRQSPENAPDCRTGGR